MAKNQPPVKYFFLSAGWSVNRVWELGGLWDESVWGRIPDIKRTNLGISEQNEQFWLYQVEDAVLMVEVHPTDSTAESQSPFGQVLLKRLMSAEQVLERLQGVDQIVNGASLD